MPKLRNVPEEGIYNWDPGALFGIYKPDGFWFDTSEMRGEIGVSGSGAAVQPAGPVEDVAQSSVRE